jgi:hypothetical protein
VAKKRHRHHRHHVHAAPMGTVRATS